MPRPTVGTVGLTGIIYGGIVVLWLCYLVPLALRRHDEAARSRSVDRFSSAMRVLGRTDAGDEPLVRRRTLRARSRSQAAGPPGEPSPAEPARVVSPAVTRAAARAAAARRRRVLVVLLALTMLVTGVAVAGLLPLWSVAAPVSLVLGFLVTARLQVSRTRTSTWERALRSAAVAAEPHVQPVGDEPDDAPTVVLDTVLEEQQVVAAPVTTVDGQSLWDPLPVTLPTYVSKPRAERKIRTIDLHGEGAWTSGHLPEPAADEEAPAAREDAVEVPVEAGVEAAPRAVGD